MNKLLRPLATTSVITLTLLTLPRAGASTVLAASTTPQAIEIARPQLTKGQNPFASAGQQEGAQQVKVALFQSGCSDPDPWYMFSGIAAATCILTGQW